jgi:hypothetical protein
MGSSICGRKNRRSHLARHRLGKAWTSPAVPRVHLCAPSHTDADREGQVRTGEAGRNVSRQTSLSRRLSRSTAPSRGCCCGRAVSRGGKHSRRRNSPSSSTPPSWSGAPSQFLEMICTDVLLQGTSTNPKADRLLRRRPADVTYQNSPFSHRPLPPRARRRYERGSSPFRPVREPNRTNDPA